MIVSPNLCDVEVGVIASRESSTRNKRVIPRRPFLADHGLDTNLTTELKRHNEARGNDDLDATKPQPKDK